MTADEVDRLRKILLDSTATDGMILAALQQLDDMGKCIDRQILATTKIGLVVGKYRNWQRNVKVAQMARKLIENWRSLVGPKKPAKPPADSSSNLNEPEQQQQTAAASPSSSQSPGTTATLNLETAVYEGPFSGDTKRDRWRDALFKAFIEGLPQEQLVYLTADVVSKLAATVETALWTHFIVRPREAGAVQSKEYALQLRSIKTNFADRKNPEFNTRVFMGGISPEQLAVMPATEMASDAKKAERQKTKKESLEACQSDWDLRNIKRAAGQFPCGKCKSSNTTYVQIQTRSSDEPMTTYVNCIDCGNRWKF